MKKNRGVSLWKHGALLAAMLMISLALLAGCGKSYKVSQKDFRFDGKISWESSYTDVVTAYGDPAKVEMTVNGVEVAYKSLQIWDEELDVKFVFEEDNGHLSYIKFRNSYQGGVALLFDRLREKAAKEYGAPDMENLDVPSGRNRSVEWDWHKTLENFKLEITEYKKENTLSGQMRVEGTYFLSAVESQKGTKYTDLPAEPFENEDAKYLNGW